MDVLNSLTNKKAPKVPVVMIVDCRRWPAYKLMVMAAYAGLQPLPELPSSNEVLLISLHSLSSSFIGCRLASFLTLFPAISYLVRLSWENSFRAITAIAFLTSESVCIPYKQGDLKNLQARGSRILARIRLILCTRRPA